MMPSDIPPPGPDRDVAIVIALGGTWVAMPDAIDGGEIDRIRMPSGALIDNLPPYSTDPATCDRLVEEMVRRGFELIHRAHADQSHSARLMIADAANNDGLAYYEGRGQTRMEAVSGAALMGLMGER